MVTQLIIWTVGIAFAVITFLTIVNVFNIEPLVSKCRADPKHKSKLFLALILEIIVICLGVAGAVLDDHNKLRDARNQAEHGFELSLEAWEAASRSWMSEPSGLSLSGLHDPDRPGIILVGVDDEESSVFVLHSQPRFPLVRAKLELVGHDQRTIVHDLEAITYDGSKYYYALASHRLKGTEKKARLSRRLVRFEISDAWQSGYDKIVVDSSIDLTDLPDGHPGLGKFLLNHGVDFSVAAWEQRGPLPQPYALELEGIVIYGNQLYLGLRVPLDSDKALLLSYSIKESKFTGICRLNLEGHGISDLTVSGDDLVVASNPPEKVDREKAPASVQYYGKSRLWKFSIDSLDFGGAKSQALKGNPLRLQAKPDAKLEGIAAVGSELFLAFEGEQPYFESIQAQEIK